MADASGPNSVIANAPTPRPSRTTRTTSHCLDMVSGQDGAAAPQVAHRPGGVGGAEHGGAGDERVRARAPGLGDGVGGDAAVHLEGGAGARAVEHRPNPADLVGAGGEIRL